MRSAVTITGFILATDDAWTIEAFAKEIAPATRELVATARTGQPVGG